MRFLAAILFVLVSTPSFAKIYIKIDEAGNQSFPIAIHHMLVKTNDSLVRRAEADFVDTVKKDLELMGVFQVISDKAILESDDKKGTLEPKKIDFTSWKTINALAFTKGVISGSGNKLTVETYLYDTLAQTDIAAKRYSGSVDQIQKMAHTFANEIIEKLLGEKGPFDTRIAYICRPSRDKELCLMDFNGENNRTLTNHKSIVLSPTWNPTNNSIYYTAFGKKSKPELYVFDLEKNESKKAGDFPGLTIGLSFDPGQKLLATSLTKDGNAEIYLLNNYGDPVKRITDNKNIDVSASFSPDGKEIVFVSDRDGTSQIYKMNRDGTQVRRLTFKGRNNTSPAWSPKGDKIVFAGMDTDGQFDILSMNTDGSGMNRLTYDTKNNEDPTWSPDGNLIAFTSTRKGRNAQIYFMRPDGTRQTQLTFENYEHARPSWEVK